MIRFGYENLRLSLQIMQTLMKRRILFGSYLLAEIPILFAGHSLKFYMTIL